MPFGTLRFLGTGTSVGVPSPGCTCEVCRSTDVHDHRLRTSALITTPGGRRILIDCGPDFRQQLLSVSFGPVEAVLLTHEHYDHVGGLDDLRPLTYKRPMPLYGLARTLSHVRERMPYCFAADPYPGVPKLDLREVREGESFTVGDVTVEAVGVMHGQMPILGYRIGPLAYITDMSRIDAANLARLEGVETLVVNALRLTPHHSHQTLSEALALIRRVAPRRAFLIHMCHQIGLHAAVDATLPRGVHLAYDGLEVRW